MTPAMTPAMPRERRDELIRVYRDGLLDDVVPFWIRHAVDREHGGFLHALDRDGTVVDTDKAIWIQGRFTWLLARLHRQVEPRPEWLELAAHGVEFLRRHAFDDDGRMFFLVTREGRPLRKRRYVYSEAFGVLALAEYAAAAGDERAGDEARRVFDLFIECTTRPGRLPPKVDPRVRPAKSIGVPMITINVAQVLRETIGHSDADAHIDRCIGEIRRDFVKPDLEVVCETVGPSGEIIDHFDGRTLNPGHAIEAAWFIMQEAGHRGDAELAGLGTTMLDWMWRRGWDDEFGGLLYYTDLHGGPVQEYWHDMKFWWPHCEAIIATLMAWRLTGDGRYLDMHTRVHDWAHEHFRDPEFGEWFGYLHRDGRLSVPLKGNHWKGPFHVPRMQVMCWGMLRES